MSDITLQTDRNRPHAGRLDEVQQSATQTAEPVPVPRPEDEGLTWRQIRWLPVLVPLAALTLSLCALLVLATA